MFEGVGDIDWASLGDEPRLSEIPELFVHLLADKPRPRTFAINQFHALLSPAGGSVDAAIAALPFLTEALLHDDVPDRQELAMLLADLAAGGLHPDLLKDGRQLNALTTDGRRLHDAIAAQAPTIAALLDAKKAPLRAAAVLPLAAIGSIDPIAAALDDEKNKTVRASLLLGYGVAAGREADAGPFEGALDAEDAGLRFAAACGLSLTRDELHPAAIDAVAAAIAEGASLPKSFPWAGGNAPGIAVLVLVGACQRADKIGPIEALFEGRKDAGLAAAMLRAALPPSDRLRLPHDLSATERGMLRIAARSKTTVDPLYSTLNRLGFTTHQPSLVRFAGGSDPGPLDAPGKDGVPLWSHVRAAMDDRIALDELRAQLPAEADLRALAEDALSAYMTLHLPFPRPSGPAQLLASQGLAKLAGLCIDLVVGGVSAETLTAWMDELMVDTNKKRVGHCLAAAVAWARVADPDAEAILAYAPVFRRSVLDGGVEDLLRPIVERLDVPQRAELLLPIGPDFVFDARVGEHIFYGVLPYLELVPTEEAARMALDAVVKHRHPPLDRLVAILRAVGPAAEPLVAETLARDDLAEPVRDALGEL